MLRGQTVRLLALPLRLAVGAHGIVHLSQPAVGLRVSWAAFNGPKQILASLHRLSTLQAAARQVESSLA